MDKPLIKISFLTQDSGLGEAIARALGEGFTARTISDQPFDQLVELREWSDVILLDLRSANTEGDEESVLRLMDEICKGPSHPPLVVLCEEENRQLKAKTGQDKPKTPLQLKEEAMAKLNYGKNWVIGSYQYAAKHDGQFPTNFEDAAAFMPDQVKKQSAVTPDQFEIVFAGKISSLEKPQDIIVLREKEAQSAGESSHPPGQWMKVYTFADGHSELHHEPSNNFDDYEKAHMISSPANQ